MCQYRPNWITGRLTALGWEFARQSDPRIAESCDWMPKAFQWIKRINGRMPERVVAFDHPTGWGLTLEWRVYKAALKTVTPCLQRKGMMNQKLAKTSKKFGYCQYLMGAHGILQIRPWFWERIESGQNQKGWNYATCCKQAIKFQSAI